ncbi:MAG: STAS domain-containing protein [Burkholderiaceae bacterium]
MTLDYTGRSSSSSRTSPSRVSATSPSPAPVAQTTSQFGQPLGGNTGTGSETVVARKRAKRADGITTLPSLGQTTDILLGDSILANAMELTDSASSPAIEEAAILYANGQPLPAVAVLTDAIQSESFSQANSQAWSMLFELYQVIGKRAEFENLAIDYAVRFETSAPAWSESASAPAPPKQPVNHANRATVTFKGTLSDNIVPQLDQLKRLAQKSPVLHLDFSQVSAADAVGADLILRVFAAFQKSNHEVVMEGAANLAERLLASIEVGRRDSSNAAWMLLLEMYRVLGRQAAFEETSIDYCVTYEVSPPSWEAPSSKFKLGDSVFAGPAEDVLQSPLPEIQDMPVDTMGLSGDLLGKAEAELLRLNNFAAEHRRIVVDCSKLRRVDFTAAGVLLNWAVGAQGANKSIEFRDVSNLVAALLVVMGVHDVAQIERRKL